MDILPKHERTEERELAWLTCSHQTEHDQSAQRPGHRDYSTKYDYANVVETYTSCQVILPDRDYYIRYVNRGEIRGNVARKLNSVDKYPPDTQALGGGFRPGALICSII